MDELTHDERLFRQWTAYRRAAGGSEKSIREEIIFLRAMLRRTGATSLDVSFDELLMDVSRPDLAASTRQTNRGTIIRYFAWLEDRGHRTDDPARKLPKVRVPRTEPNPFNIDDVMLLLKSVYTKQRIWILLYAYQGMRAGEIASLRGEAVHLESGTIRIKGKGGLVVTRPLHPLVRAELERQSDRFPSGAGTGYMFPKQKLVDGRVEPTSAATVSNTLRKAIVRSGLSAKGHRAHDLRKFFATAMMDNGADLYTVSQAMRHASPATTARHYVRPNEELIRTAMERIPTVDVPRTSSRDEDVREFPPAWRAPITMWRARMRTERLRPTTLRDRTSILGMLATLVDSPDQVAPEHIRDLIASAPSEGTARNYVSACSTFFGFLYQHGLSDIDPSSGLRSGRATARQLQATA